MTETIVHRVEQLTRARPDRTLFELHDAAGAAELERLSYARLWARGERVGAALEALGAPRPRVLIVLPLGIELLEAHFGSLLAGGVPAIHAHPSAKVAEAIYLRQLEHVLASLSPDAVITNAHFAGAIRLVHEGAVLDVAELPNEGFASPRGWTQRGPEDVAIVQHSSGSTGLQKGVALTHAMVLGQCDAYAEALRADPELDRVASWIPLYHDMGLFTSWLLPLVKGIPVAAIDPFAWVGRPSSFLRLVSDTTATLAWMPNFAYNLLAARVRDAEIADVDLSSMRGFNNCSEPVRASSHRAFLARFAALGVREDALWTCYAMAENSFAVTTAGAPGVEARTLEVDPVAFGEGRVVPQPGGLELVSCGEPIAGCAVELRDPARAPTPDGRVGEIAIRSPYTLDAYFANPEATARAIDAEGWYHTGDLGFLHEGHLYVTGREKDLLIVGGRNFYPQDIEAVVDGCPGAVPGRSVAIGVDDEATGTQRIVVLAETREPAAGERLELAVRERVSEQLDCPLSEVHAVPHMWLHKTTSGKIARAPNLERFRAELEPRRPAAPAAGPLSPLRSWGLSMAWGVLVACAVYVVFALQPNLSWGIYAGF